MLGSLAHRSLLVSAAVLSVLSVVAAPPAVAATTLRAFPTAPASVITGDTGVPASLTVRNNSTPPESSFTWSVTALKLAPSCAATTSNTTCTTPEIGVLIANAAGTGRAGTSCAGMQFAFAAPDGLGVQTITPSSPLVLGPTGGGSDVCIIDFTFKALKLPTKDADTVLSGLQTLMVGFISATSNTGDLAANARATQTVTVRQRVHEKVADFDGDGKSDIAVYRPAGYWFIQRSTGGGSVFNWGSPGDLPAAADYDGDGRTDVAIFRPAGALFYVMRSSGGTTVVNWGSEGDIPMPGDFDGDGQADIAVYRPDGFWFVRNSRSGAATIVNWGSPGDVPAHGDFDGDGKTDFAVFRPSNAFWYIRNSSDGTMRVVNWGADGDIPRAGDFDGDGKTDIAVFRPAAGVWYISRSGGGTTVVNWGGPGDVPGAGDYDGDGKTDFTVFRESQAFWYISRSSAGTSVVNWGAAGDYIVGPPPAIPPTG